MEREDREEKKMEVKVLVGEGVRICDKGEMGFRCI